MGVRGICRVDIWTGNWLMKSWERVSPEERNARVQSLRQEESWGHEEMKNHCGYTGDGDTRGKVVRDVVGNATRSQKKILLWGR